MTSTTSGSVGAGSRDGSADESLEVIDERAAGAEVDRPRATPWWFWPAATAGGIGLFVVHLVQIAQLRSPVIYYDEGGYLGNARYMVSGYGRNGGNYYAGYSLFLTPAAALTHAATAYFHGALITNAVLAVVTAFLALVLSRRLTPEAPAWVPLVAAGLVASCPFVFTFVGIAMSENALIPTTLLAAVLVARAAQTGSSTARLGAVAAAGFAYWVTPRGVIVSGAALLALAILTVEQRRPWLHLAVEVVAMGVVLGAGQVFEAGVRGNAHVTGVTGRPHGLLSSVFTPSDWRMVVAGSLGRFAYLGVASAGFVLVGIVIGVVWLAPRGGRSTTELARVRRSVSAFAVVAVVVTAVADATAIAGVPSLSRLDYLYYGRYAEAVAMPALVIGASWLLTTACAPRRSSVRAMVAPAFVAGASIAVMGLLTRALATQRPPDTTVNPVTVLGLYPIRLGLPHLGVHAPTVSKQLLFGSVIVFGVLLLVSSRVRVLAIVPLVVLTLASIVVHDHYLRPGSQSRGTQGTLAHAVQTIGAAGVPISCVDQHPPISSFWYLADYQFLQPETKFAQPGEPPTRSCPLVITSDPAWGKTHPGDRLVGAENYAPIALWLTPSMLTPAERVRIAASGDYLPDQMCDPLPPDAYRAAIQVSVRGAAHATSNLSRVGLDLHVTHTGRGAPWIGSHAVTSDDACGRVEIALSVENEQGQTVFERTAPTPNELFPSETWHVRTALAAPHAAPALPAGHRYLLRVRLVQQGVRDFGGPDGNGVTVPLATN